MTTLPALLAAATIAHGQQHYEQALRFCRESGGASDVAHALTQLGDLACKQGDNAAISAILPVVHLTP